MLFKKNYFKLGNDENEALEKALAFFNENNGKPREIAFKNFKVNLR